MGQVRLELRGLHSQDLLSCQLPLISEKESLSSTQGLVIPDQHIQSAKLLQKRITTFPSKYLTAQTKQVLEHNPPLTLSSLFPPAITLVLQTIDILDVYLKILFKIKMGGKDCPVATISTQPSIKCRRSLVPNPGNCPKPTST